MSKQNEYGCFVKVDDYPKYAIELARKRMRGLMNFNIIQTQSIACLLESAYLQGLTDAAEAVVDKDLPR